jgi:anti-sigma factor ChrR (cupin superfamily)
MNKNYDKRVSIDTNSLDWGKTSTVGIFKKTLSVDENRETSIMKFDINSKFGNTKTINSVEIFVLEGTYINEFGEFKQGTYLRLPKESESYVRSDLGCTIFRLKNYIEDNQEVIISTESFPWLHGQGNLEVISLFNQTALVKWPKNERFIPHKHWGGEEVFVLKGTFMDEHGKYPTGHWLRSPHLSEHYPFVEDETIIWVKTGHL